MARTFTIDGRNFKTLEGFYEEFSRSALPDVTWGRNLDAFDDVLSGGVGLVGPGDAIVWKNPMLSRLNLGYDETVRQLERQLIEADTSQQASIGEALALARNKKGETVYDWIVEILREHDDINVQFE